MKHRLFLCLFLSVYLLTIGGCAAPEMSAAVPPETTVSLPPETDAFSFIVPGETTILEVLEKVPYEAKDTILAVNYMHLDYPLPDGSEVWVYFLHPSNIVTEVILVRTDGSLLPLKIPTEPA